VPVTKTPSKLPQPHLSALFENTNRNGICPKSLFRNTLIQVLMIQRPSPEIDANSMILGGRGGGGYRYYLVPIRQ